MGDKNFQEMFDSLWKREGTLFIQFILDAGLDINALNKFGKTMLSYAAECGHLQIAEFLVQEGADSNFANSEGSKPLHIAAQYGRKDIVKFFLNRGISVDSRDKDKCTPLHYLAAKSYNSSDGRESYQELVHILVDRNADIDALDRKGRTPLLLAAQTSRKHLVELFVRLGANLECCDEDQWTVLHHACEKGWSGIVRTLVEGRFGIDLNARTSVGDTPALLAAIKSYEDIVKLLVASGVDWNEETLLHVACRRGLIEVVRSIVSKGGDLNAKDKVGITPLMGAADCNHLSVVEHLIECGVDVECCDKDGWTALHYACRNGWLEGVKSLVSKGCDLNAKDITGETPLMCAAVRKHLSVVEHLIECGADVEGCDEYGHTVLHYACAYGLLEVAKSLLKKGSRINAQSVYHDTPLHLAIENGVMEIIEYLLIAGADCNLVNIQGNTAFNMFVQKSRCLEVIVLFLRSGAYFQTAGYTAISDDNLLRECILQNAQLCTVALMNKFLNADLPQMYAIPSVSGRLPRIEKLKDTCQSMEEDIAESVEYEIQTKGFCDVLNVRPFVLRRLCVFTLVKHYNSGASLV